MAAEHKQHCSRAALYTRLAGNRHTARSVSTVYSLAHQGVVSALLLDGPQLRLGPVYVVGQYSLYWVFSSSMAQMGAMSIMIQMLTEHLSVFVMLS